MAVRRADSFGYLLRRYRKQAGLTQEQLAELAGLSVRGISDLERGVNRAPYRSTVVRLADALQLSPRDRAILEEASSRFAPSSEDAYSGKPQHGSTARVPLIGRDREVGIVRRHLRGDLPPLLAVAGEPGIGKTRLLQAAAGLAGEMGLPSLYAGCGRSAAEQPYAPISDALSSYVYRLPRRDLRAALTGCGWLSCLLPELSELVGALQPVGSISSDQERRLLEGAVSRFLENIAAPGGVALLLDDLQWAGSDALELLLSLCRSASGMRLCIIGAYRATETGGDKPLATMLADAAHAGLVHQIELAPLEAAESAELIDALGETDLRPDTREQVLQRSGGVPFFLVSWVSALHSGDGSSDAVPWTVAQSVRQRVAALPNTTQDVLAAAALAGRVVTADVIIAVMNLPPLMAVEAIDAARHAGLLMECDERSYAFTHDVIREVVEAGLGSARRMHLHLAIAEALERSTGGTEAQRAGEIAWHFGRGNDAGRAVPYALLAGDHAASLYAHRDAAELYRAAAGYAAQTGNERAEAEASENAGRELTVVADYTAAVAVLEHAASLYRALGDLDAEARVVAQLGWAHCYRATPNQAMARVESLVEQLQDRPAPASLARLYVTLTFLWYADRPHDALMAAERACSIAEELGDNHLLAAARVRHGLLLGRIGRWAQAEPVLRQASEIAERIGDAETLAHAVGFTGMACGMQGKLEESLAYYFRATEIIRRFGDPTVLAYALRSCAGTCFQLGDWQAARAYYEEAWSVDATAPSTFSALIPLGMMQLAMAHGDWGETDGLASESLARDNNQSNDRVDTNVLCLLAERDLLQGRPQDALARLQPRLPNFYADETVNLGVRVTPVEVCAIVGEIDLADDLLSQYANLIAQQGNDRSQAGLQRARGIVRAAQGRWGEAEDAFSRAHALASDMKCPLERGCVLLAWARACRDAGDCGRALVLAREADEVFRCLGAAPYAAQSTVLLEELKGVSTGA